jgi:hypothetical protein
MDHEAILALYDEQVRRSPPPAPGGERVEREPHLTRILRERDGWAMISWSDLEGLDVDEVIAAEIERLAPAHPRWEWKHYSYDSPGDLPRRLSAAGFEAGELETVLVAEIAELSLDERLPPGVELEIIYGADAARQLVRMQDEIFGGGSPGMAERLIAGIEADPPASPPSQAAPMWPAGGWSSSRAAISPACGAGPPSRSGAAEGSSVRSWPAARRWPPSAATASLRSMRCRRAARFSNASASPSWRRRPPTPTYPVRCSRPIRRR